MTKVISGNAADGHQPDETRREMTPFYDA